jgi:hypothetical protein
MAATSTDVDRFDALVMAASSGIGLELTREWWAHDFDVPDTSPGGDLVEGRSGEPLGSLPQDDGAWPHRNP